MLLICYMVNYMCCGLTDYVVGARPLLEVTFLIGALLGDIIGSTRELHNIKSMDFDLFPAGSHFTDDSVMSIAVAEKFTGRRRAFDCTSPLYV